MTHRMMPLVIQLGLILGAIATATLVGVTARILACRGANQLPQVLTGSPAEPSVQTPSAAAPQAAESEFALGNYIKPDLIKLDIEATAKQDAIIELLDMLEAGGLVSDPQAARKALLDREAKLSTGVGSGIAIPHGRTDGVDRLLCVVGIAREGIDFGAIDGQPVTIVVLVLTPKDGVGPYLQFVASVMAVLDDAGRQSVLSAKSGQELWSVLTQTPTGPDRVWDNSNEV